MHFLLFSDSSYRKGPRLSFFPPLATFEPPYPVAPDGIIPNSALLQVQHIHSGYKILMDLTPTVFFFQSWLEITIRCVKLLRKSEADMALAQTWAPPVLSDQQRRLMAEMEDEVSLSLSSLFSFSPLSSLSLLSLLFSFSIE